MDPRLVAKVMTTTFEGSDAEGAWLWRDGYDAIEAALVMQLRRLAPQIKRLEDAKSDLRGALSCIKARFDPVCGPNLKSLATTLRLSP